MTDPRRRLPAVGTLLVHPDMQALLRDAPRAVVTEAVRAVIERARTSADAPLEAPEWADAVRDEVRRRTRPSLRPLLNATGVVLHTNMGRAPLPQAAVDAMVRVAASGSNLEYDTERGTRGSRSTHCAGLLRELTGAEDALVVNNGAAALVLALNTVADGREAIVSRGELVEIGGSFRVPDIMARSGARLREVGTTNRTHVADYRQAVGDATGVIVKVHHSNFEQRGFVAEASVGDLAGVARDAGIPLLFDLGSGLLLSLEAFGLTGEPTAADAIREGAALVVMSGDKLLGGPQAGILLGTSAAVAACRQNPLARALRTDKLTLAALEATLTLYRDPERAVREIPTLAMLTMSAETVRERADRAGCALRAAGIACGVVASRATVGGGAFPTAELPSWAVAPDGDAPSLEARLRGSEPAVIGRVAGDRLLLDLRSVPPALDDAFVDAVARALGAS
jgi:L-seryl-tRNA(Ser) seleniumtransferase